MMPSAKKERERKKKRKRKRLLSFAFSSAIKFLYLDSYRKLPKSRDIPCLHALSGTPVTRTVINTATIMNHGRKAKLALRQIMKYNLRRQKIWISYVKRVMFVCLFLGLCFCLCNGCAEPFLPRNDICSIK